jgi:hypothetical protein
MDITPIEIDKMKLKQLRRLIRESVMEVIKEDAALDKKAQDTAKSSTQAQFQALQKKKSELSSITTVSPADKPAHDAEKMAVDKKIAVVTKKLQTLNKPGLSSVELDEMSRPARGLRLVNPNFDTTGITKIYKTKDKQTGQVREIPLRDIIEYIKDNPGVEKKQLYTHFKLAKPQQADAIANGLTDAGILVKLTPAGEEVAPVAPGEEAPVQASEPEDLFMGSAENPLAMYFDNIPNDDGDEDFNDEEEPTADELEPVTATPTGGMSDADYEAWMKYDTLKNRLDATKSNITKAKRSKSSGVAGDLSDKATTDVPRLITLKQSLEDRMNDLVKGSKYLQTKIEKETGKAYVEPISTPEEDENDTLNEAYDLRKLQFYAGIIR